jgi:hypothetical protein
MSLFLNLRPSFHVHRTQELGGYTCHLKKLLSCVDWRGSGCKDGLASRLEPEFQQHMKFV